MILIPYDKYGIVTSLSKLKIDTDKFVSHKVIADGQRYFLDFESKSPAQTNVSVDLGNSTNKNLTIYFAPNCKSQIKLCIKNPKFAWWYLMAILGSRGK